MVIYLCKSHDPKLLVQSPLAVQEETPAHAIEGEEGQEERTRTEMVVGLTALP
jgi:hypothetical protein